MIFITLIFGAATIFGFVLTIMQLGKDDSSPAIPLGTIGALLLTIASLSFKVIPAGHYGTAVLFGEVQQQPYAEGLQFPVNPLYNWTEFDSRHKTYKLEDATIQTSDELTSIIDLSVQYRVNGAIGPQLLRETGNTEAIINTHLVPSLRSILREQGKAVPTAQALFDASVQRQLQDSILAATQEYLKDKGIDVSEVLVREVRLPIFITAAIAEKKKREQEVERERAELERKDLEYQQKIRAAAAEKEAAAEQAEAIKTLADARAYEIKAVQEAIRQDDSYIQLQALQTLTEISKDDAAKIYFINGDSPSPLPLMHIATDK